MRITAGQRWAYSLAGAAALIVGHANADISGAVDSSLNGSGFKLLEFRTEGMADTEHRSWNHPVLAAAAHADGSVLVMGESRAWWEGGPTHCGIPSSGCPIPVIMQYDENFEQIALGETRERFVYSGVFSNDANKLVALGSNGTSRNLYRFNLDGALDAGFANDGILHDADGLLGSGYGTGSTPMKFDSEGRLLVYMSGLIRISADGTLDSSFGDGGVAAAPSGSGGGVDITQTGDGAWYAITNSGNILRFTASGDLDTDFGEGGVLDSGTSSQRVSGIAAMPDNGVVTLVNTSSQGTQAKLVHFGPTGELVNESGHLLETDWQLADGTNMVQLGYGPGASLMTLDNGQVLFAINWQGRTPEWDVYGYQLFGLFNSDLTPDTTFDSDNGLIIHETIHATNNSHPVTSRLLTLDNKGRILHVSHTGSSGNDNITDGMSTWAVARLMGSWDGEDGGSGSDDTTPDAFQFPGKTDVAVSTAVTSDAATISGIDAAASVSVSNGEYSIGCTSSFTDANGAINNDENICVRHTSAAEYSTSTTTTLTVGGVSADFVSTTQADPGGTQDTTPDAFSFDGQTDVGLGDTVTSSAITVTGIDAPASISVSNGSYAIDDGDFTTSPGTVENGQSVAVQHQAASECLGSVTTTLTIGGEEGSFTSTTSDSPVDSDGDGVSDCLDDTPFDATSANPVLPGGNTLAMSTDDGSFSGIEILDADAQTSQAGRPDSMDFPYGLASYEVTGLNNGDTVTVTLTYPAVLPAGTRIFKYSDGDGFVEMSSAVISGSTVTLTLTDGGEGDADGVANGTIVDPVGPATPEQARKRSSSGGSLSWMLLTLFGLLGLRRKRQL